MLYTNEKIAYESTIFMDKIFWKYFSELSKKTGKCE